MSGVTTKLRLQYRSRIGETFRNLCVTKALDYDYIQHYIPCSHDDFDQVAIT